MRGELGACPGYQRVRRLRISHFHIADRLVMKGKKETQQKRVGQVCCMLRSACLQEANRCGAGKEPQLQASPIYPPVRPPTQLRAHAPSTYLGAALNELHSHHLSCCAALHQHSGAVGAVTKLLHLWHPWVNQC